MKKYSEFAKEAKINEDVALVADLMKIPASVMGIGFLYFILSAYFTENKFIMKIHNFLRYFNKNIFSVLDRKKKEFQKELSKKDQDILIEIIREKWIEDHSLGDFLDSELTKLSDDKIKNIEIFKKINSHLESRLEYDEKKLVNKILNQMS